MSTEKQQFTEIAERLRQHLDELLVGVVQEPLTAALDQIPVIMEREDMSMEDKQQAVQQLQHSLVMPLVGSVASVAQASGMQLKDVLYHIGDAWEQIAKQRMTAMAQGMMEGGADEEAPE